MTSVAKALEIPVVITQQYTKVFGDTVSDCFADEDDLKKTPMFEKKNFSMCTQEGRTPVRRESKLCAPGSDVAIGCLIYPSD